jgi:Zn-dependent protease with chaperone function
VALLALAFFYIGDSLRDIIFWAYDGQPGGWASRWVTGHMEWLIGISIVLAIVAHELIAYYLRKEYTMCPVEGAREYAMLDKLCAISGVNRPNLLYIPEGMPNAFVTGIFGRRVLCLMEDIRDLTDEQLEAVMAHELSHLKHYDIRSRATIQILPMVVALQLVMARFVMSVAFVLALANWMGVDFMMWMTALSAVIALFGFFSGKSSDFIVIFAVVFIFGAIGLAFASVGSTWDDFLFLFVAFLALSIGRIVIGLILGWFSQSREFLADAGAAIMLGNGENLIKALYSIKDRVEGKTDLASILKRLPKFVRKPLLMFGKAFGFGLFANKVKLSAFIINKLAPSHPSLERREKALKLFSK